MISAVSVFNLKLSLLCNKRKKKEIKKKGRLHKEIYIYLKRQNVIQILLLPVGKSPMQPIMPRRAALLPLHLKPYLGSYLLSAKNLNRPTFIAARDIDMRPSLL